MEWKKQDWKARDQIAGVENAGLHGKHGNIMYVCMYKNLCSRSSLQPRLSRRRYDQL